MLVPTALESGAAIVEVALEAGRSVVRRVRAESPLRILCPRSAGGHAAWVVSSSFGGGIVDGDAIALDVTVRRGASAILTTQASTKVYRAPRGSSQTTAISVEEDATVVSIPDHVASFAGARFDQRARVALADRSAALVWLDLQSAGRSARGERWDMASLTTSLAIVRGDRLLLRDALVLDPAHGDLRRRMGRFDVLGTIVVLGDRFASAGASLLSERAPPRPADGLVVAASALHEGAMIRFAAVDVALALAFARACLGFVGDAVGVDPWARRA